MTVQGREIELAEGEISLGRSQSANVSVKDSSVSRNHASIQARDGRLTVRDLNSSNGTFLNGMRIFADAELHDGDRLTLGESEMTVRIQAPESVAATMRIDPRMLLAGEELRLQAEEEARGPAAPAAPAPPAPPAVRAIDRAPVPPPAPPASAPAPERGRSVHDTGPAPIPPRPPAPPVAPISFGAPVGGQAPAPAPAARPAEPPAGAAPPRPAPLAAPPAVAAVVTPLAQALRAVPEVPVAAPPLPAAPSPALVAEPSELLPSLPDLDPLPARPAAARPAGMSNVPGPAAPSAAPAGDDLGLPDLDLPPLPPVEATPPRPVTRPGVSRPVPVALQLQPAGFWIRVCAALLDSLWIGAVCAGLWFATGNVLDDEGRAKLVGAVWFVLDLGSRLVGWSLWGWTPGKRLLGLYVCPAGSSVPGVGFGKGLLRCVGYWVSAMTLGVGFVLAAFTQGKRGLHDMIAGTYVGKRKPA